MPIVHFTVAEKRFDAIDWCFEALHRQMHAYFGTMDKRPTMFGWTLSLDFYFV